MPAPRDGAGPPGTRRIAAPPGLVVAAMRSASPRALAILVRRWGAFHDAEDAVQEASAAASEQWPRTGIPDSPVAWLVTVASRRMADASRSDRARREREHRAVAQEAPASEAEWEAGAGGESGTDVGADDDDTLALYLLCCHPSLSRGSQVALTLRCLGGLTTREIARGLLLAEATVGQRISRAKSQLRAVGRPFAPVAPTELSARIGAVLEVLGVIYTESHSAAEGEAIARPALGAEALRLARQLAAGADPSAPWRGEARGLVALILLTEARAPARLDAEGELVALAEQDRSLWRDELIAEGTALVTEALAGSPLGPFQLRAAIAAVHDEARSADDTRWREILGLYDLLRVLDPGPIVELARLVALGEVLGPDRALLELAAVDGAPALRVAAVRAHLNDRAGRRADAAAAFAEAARLTGNGAERRWFAARATRD